MTEKISTKAVIYYQIVDKVPRHTIQLFLEKSQDFAMHKEDQMLFSLALRRISLTGGESISNIFWTQESRVWWSFIWGCDEIQGVMTVYLKKEFSG